MFKKILFAILVVFALLISARAEEYPAADPSAQLEQAAVYKREGYLKRAEKIYQDILRNYPGTDDALKAQRGLVSLYISAERVDDAQAAIDKLTADFSAEPNQPTVLCLIALRYQEVGKYEEAESIYQGIVTDYSATDEALKAQRGLVSLYISADRDNDVQAAMDKLTIDFSGHPDLPLMLRQIAKRYEEVEKYEEARSVHETIVTDFPATNDALKAQKNLVILYISAKRDDDVQAAMEKLTTDFSGHPDLPMMLRQIAERYEEVEKYEEAESIYQGIVTDFPASNDALKAQKNLVIPYISTNRDDDAQAALDKLSADFSGHPDLPLMLGQIAQRYENVGEYEGARSVYETIVTDFPDSNDGLRAQFDTSRMDILSFMEWGDDPNAQAAIESLITDFNDYQRLPNVLLDFARKYRKANEYEQAEDIYQQVAQQFPDSNDALREQMAAPLMKILSFIKGGYDAAATAAIDNLIADFNDHPYLPTAVFVAGQQYYNKARLMQSEGLTAEAADNFQKTVAVWEKVIQKLPASAEYTPRFYYITAVVYSQELADYQKGIDYYDIIVANWPDYQYAWHAQYFVGLYYDRLLKSGGITKAEALPRIEQAYQAVVENYPDCGSAKYAALQLGWLNFNRGQWVDAAWYFEFLLQKAPENQKRSHILYHLGQAYEKMGQLDSAIDVYGEFMIAADPNDPWIKTVTARLEELIGAKN